MHYTDVKYAMLLLKIRMKSKVLTNHVSLTVTKPVNNRLGVK